MDRTYIGDGVYASHDGYQIWLEVGTAGGRTRIALEPEVMQALIVYYNSFRGSEVKDAVSPR
jgi:hypothetical protein